VIMDYGYAGDAQFSTTSYGGQGAVNGGGFMPGGGSQGGQGGKRHERDEALHPVTIKQLIEAEAVGEDFKIDGEIYSQVCIVGQIQNVSSQSTNISYRLDDGTGTIDVRKWIDEEARMALEAGTMSPVPQDTYVKVWGKLKEHYSKRHVGAQFVRPVSDYNEVTYHLLQATLVHLQQTKGPLGATKGGATGNAGGDSMDHAGGKDLPGMSLNAKKVYNLLSVESMEGVPIHEIAQKLGLQLNQASKATQELLDGGLIYSTGDNDTYAIIYD